MHALAHHSARQFTGNISAVEPLGNGLINDTFLVTTTTRQFVLQRINTDVFPAPAAITDNLLVIDRHLQQKHRRRLTLPGLLPTLDGRPFYRDDNAGYWRAQHFIAPTTSLETLASLADAEQVGYALGHFHWLLSDLNPSCLHDTLPGFHITPDYLARYRDCARQSQPPDRYCAEFIECYATIADRLEIAKQQGVLPLRAIHGDPKLNNFLFDSNNRRIVSLIDLDTVKPGLVHYDIGDCLRSCCHDPASDGFDLTICAAILRCYLAEASGFLQDDEYAFLYPAIQLMPFELGLRFYTDYLEGNRYFKVTTPDQNLQRAIRQFRLCADITAKQSAICTLIESCRRSIFNPDMSLILS